MRKKNWEGKNSLGHILFIYFKGLYVENRHGLMKSADNTKLGIVNIRKEAGNYAE